LKDQPLRSNTTHSRRPHQISRPYLIINWAFAAIIAGIITYAALYDPDRGDHPIPSGYQVVAGDETISTGLSRSFSALVRFRFDDAKEFNAYGPRIFLFFAVQLILRLALLAMMLNGKWQISIKLQKGTAWQARRWLILSDAAQSLVLFIFCFWPFLAFWMDLIQAG
jgi:hypothetical protein